MSGAPILVTGGAGFIGSAVVRRLLRDGEPVINVDALTYAGNLDSVGTANGDPNYAFVHATICDATTMRRAFSEHMPRAVIHLAAETHVDRSIDGPMPFIETNVNGTAVMLHEATRYWRKLPEVDRAAFRFVHVSTDEVFGSLGETSAFTERSAYAPSSPYAASKAASDHLARAWQNTYGLPVVITNCSNNYGPYQFPEKLIPLTILHAMEGRPLPVYGDGRQVRDWLHVEDHADALLTVLARGKPGESYNIGGESERQNIEIVRGICGALDELRPRRDGRGHAELIEFVTDRPGHDRRYAIDPTKIRKELGWSATHPLEQGLRDTVCWYLENRWWWERVRSGAYRGDRLGLGVVA